MIVFAGRGSSAILLYERGLVARRRGRITALPYGQVARIVPRYGRFVRNRDKVLGYELVARNGKTLALSGTRGDFLTTLAAVVRGAGGEVVGL